MKTLVRDLFKALINNQEFRTYAKKKIKASPVAQDFCDNVLPQAAEIVVESFKVEKLKALPKAKGGKHAQA